MSYQFSDNQRLAILRHLFGKRSEDRYTRKEVEAAIEWVDYNLMIDPYGLTVVSGISFDFIDKTFIADGGSLKDRRRLGWAAVYAMKGSRNCYFSENDLAIEICRYLNSPKRAVNNNAVVVKVTCKREVIPFLPSDREVILENERYWLEAVREAEIELADNLKKLASGDRLSILTGAAGTGKSTETGKFVRQLKGKSEELAPTHTAKKVLARETGKSAQTVQRFTWLLKRSEPVAGSSDGITWTTDEFSMISLMQARDLAHYAVETGAALHLVGDPNQLPSIACGQVFHDVLRAAPVMNIPVTELTVNYRSILHPGIIAAAESVLAGEVPVDGQDFRICNVTGDEAVSQLIADVACFYNENTPIDKRPRALTATNKVAAELNTGMQEILNPRRYDEPEYSGYGRYIRTGDSVVNIENHNDIALQNGDLGVVLSVHIMQKHFHYDSGYLLVMFESQSEPTAYTFGNCRDEGFPIREISLAYATTVHKSQGAGIDDVYICIPYDSRVDSRNSLYTAITRARKSVKMYGPRCEIASAIRRKIERGTRNTLLFERLVGDTDS